MWTSPMRKPRPDAGHCASESCFQRQAGGLVVDYLGLAEELKQALADYTNSKGKGDITLDQKKPWP